jgi:hypothetical protein
MRCLGWRRGLHTYIHSGIVSQLCTVATEETGAMGREIESRQGVVW